jgi:hypothetical protein
MPAEFDIRPMVEKYSSIPMDRLRVLRNFDDVHLPNIRRGILFIFAAWSGPSALGLQRFTKLIKSFDTGSLDVVILDIDCLTEGFAKELFGSDSFTIGGWGEAAWIRDGRVVARELTHIASERVMAEHTRSLLDENRA